MDSFDEKSTGNHAQMLHVWYIYLHNWVILGVNVGKYSSTMVRIWVLTIDWPLIDNCCINHWFFILSILYCFDKFLPLLYSIVGAFSPPLWKNMWFRPLVRWDDDIQFPVLWEKLMWKKTKKKTYLVGGWATPLKNMIKSIGMMKFPTYGKIKLMATIHHQPAKHVKTAWVWIGQVNSKKPLIPVVYC